MWLALEKVTEAICAAVGVIDGWAWTKVVACERLVLSLHLLGGGAERMGV